MLNNIYLDFIKKGNNMSISHKIETIIQKASFIRQMFEKGAQLKKEHGAENVFDFSLGNPNLDPPKEFHEALSNILASNEPMMHAYMPNIGYPKTREAVAAYVGKEQGVDMTLDQIIMTCGAAGAINVTFKSILNPGDEVLTVKPYFVEYGFYADNSGGTLVTVDTNEDFTLNIEAIEQAITPKTKVMLINSPNNPTGQIYNEESLKQLGELLRKKSDELGHTIYLISDEPYRKIVYDGAVVPSIFKAYENSIIVTSFSKDISIPGERLGYIAINPNATYKTDLLNGMAVANRILGFVNAPALFQKAIVGLLGKTVDINEYARKRRLLCDGLKDAGYDFIEPPGAFYLFPKSPIEDDVKFVEALQEALIIAVPGSAFGAPGHFRLTYCVDDMVIKNALPGFKKVINSFK